MRREMEKIRDRFSNKGQNALECKMVPFYDETFLTNNIHLTIDSQFKRLAYLRQ